MASRIEVIDGKQFKIESGWHWNPFKPIRGFNRYKGTLCDIRWGGWVKLSKAEDDPVDGGTTWREIATIKI